MLLEAAKRAEHSHMAARLHSLSPSELEKPYMPTEQTRPGSRPALTKDQLTLGPVDSCHVRVLGIVPHLPTFPYPLEKAYSLTDRPFLSEASDYQESPIWDWAGELLAKA